jgi:hypothetical protein
VYFFYFSRSVFIGVVVALPAHKRFSGDACFAGLLAFPGCLLVGPHANNAAAPRAERGFLPPYSRVPTTIWVPTLSERKIQINGTNI